jgi:hypothetical protein
MMHYFGCASSSRRSMRLKSEMPFVIQIDRSRNATGTGWQLSLRIRALSNFDYCGLSMHFDVRLMVA